MPQRPADRQRTRADGDCPQRAFVGAQRLDGMSVALEAHVL
jgi:hypothetical protein